MRKGESIGHGDIPYKRLSSCPWNECSSIGSLAISSVEADWLLDDRNLCALNGPSYDVIQVRVSYMPGCTLFRQDRPWSPLASTYLPQEHVWDSQSLAPSFVATDIQTISSLSRSPTTVIGGACSQSPECLAQAESRWSWSIDDSALDKRSDCATDATGPSHAFWMPWEALWDLLSAIKTSKKKGLPLCQGHQHLQVVEAIWRSGAGVWMQPRPIRRMVPAFAHSWLLGLHSG